MKLNKFFRLLTIVLFCPFYSFTQQYLFDIESINIKDGLPEREVFDVLIDKKGYLWLSTQGAISRYDGTKFKTYTSRDLNINEYSSTSLGVDKNNNIWYIENKDKKDVNNSGVIESQTDSILTIPEYTDNLFTSKELISLNYGYNNSKNWYVTTRGGVIYKYENGNFEKVFEEKIKFHSHFHYEPSGKDESWIFHNGEAIRLENKQPIQSFLVDKSHIVSSKIIQNQPNLIIETYHRNSLFNYWEFKNNRFHPYINNNLSSYKKILLLNENFNTFIVEDSIIILADDGQELFRQKKPAYGNPGNSYFYKSQDILFVPSDNGLLKISRKKNPFKTYYTDGSIRAVHHENNSLWISGYIGNKKINQQTGLEKDAPFLLAHQKEKPKFAFTRILKTTDSLLWVGTNSNRLLKYKEGEKKTNLYQVDDNFKRLLVPFENFKTKKLWIGTNKGLTYLDRETQEIKPYNLSNIEEEIDIKHFHQNEMGIWMLSSNGIFLMDTDTDTLIKHYTEADGLPHFNFVHLHEDTKGIFWLASKGGGLIRWNLAKNTFRQFTKMDGLSDNVLYAVYEDDCENLWLPSNYGLMQFEKNTYNTKVYLPKHGIPHEEFNTYAHTQAADGTLYFGGLGGVIGFHPKEMQEDLDNYRPPLYINSIKILEEDQDEFREITQEFVKQNTIQLSPKYQTLTIELSLLDFESTKDKQYAYRIEGYQDQWVYTNNNTISLYKIPYGQYQVNIKAKGPSGAVTKDSLQFPLIILSPFYLKWWFLLSLSIIAICGIIAYIKKREINLQKDRERLSKEMRKRTATIAAQAEELKLLDKAKTRFFSNITHEFRTPLTLVIGPLEQIMKTPEIAVLPSKLKGVLKNAKQILHLINQLLDISKLESGQMNVEIYFGNIIDYTKELVEGFDVLAKQNNQRLIFHANSDEWETQFDKEKWNKIIYNLLFNAIKFTPNGGAIQLSVAKIIKDQKEWIQLKVKDTGIGLTKQQLPKIFNRYYQTVDSKNRPHEGTGIGLALVKELVKLQKGEIWVTSRLNQGTTFDIQIPIPNIYNKLDLAYNLERREVLLPIDFKGNIIEKTEKNQKNQRFHILIIEDNRKMLGYIHSCLDTKKYNISTAKDGEEGVQKAITLVPDLIISDVMMPKKDGFKLTQEIRQTVATSHIPIILLTARATLENKLIGLERGADAYLAKPFSALELNLRIQKLIELRQIIQHRYQRDNFYQEEKNSNSMNEDVFIIDLRAYILENISDTNLNGENIAGKMGISRMQLHRKLKALTNYSISKYIQLLRLEIAYKLLKQQKLNISEITYQSGFNNPNHFSRVFKQKYGRPPSRILQKTSKEKNSQFEG